MFSGLKTDKKMIVYYAVTAFAAAASSVLSFLQYGRLNPGRTAAFALLLCFAFRSGVQGAAFSGAALSALFSVINPGLSPGILSSGVSGMISCLFHRSRKIQQSALFFLSQVLFSYAAGYDDDIITGICIDMTAAVIIFVFVPVRKTAEERSCDLSETDDGIRRHISYQTDRAAASLDSVRKSVDEISYLPLSADRNIRNRISDITEISLRKISGDILSSQIRTASGLISGFVPGLFDECISDPEMSERIRNVLYENDIGFTSVFAYENRYGRMYAEIYCSRNSCVNGYSIYKTMSEVFGKSFECSKSYTGDDVRYLISERPGLNVETNIVQKCSEGEKCCGDTCDCFRDEKGCVYAVISDGMGRGGCAASDSSEAVSLLRELVTGGIDIEHSVRILNSVMITRTEGESFTTLDIARFDLDSGQVTVYKYGAAPSLLIRSSCSADVVSDSYPVGIMTETEPLVRTLNLCEGDVFVMVSDGVPESVLRDAESRKIYGKTDVCSISDEICKNAQNISKDDISVIAVKILCKKK